MGSSRAPGAGRRPTPTVLKALAGNPGHRPLNANEPQPEASKPRCPPVLQGEARAEWRRMSRRLHRIGLLTEIDGPLLTTYCLTWARLIEAEEAIRKTGTILLRDGVFHDDGYLRFKAIFHTHAVVALDVEGGSA